MTTFGRMQRLTAGLLGVLVILIDAPSAGANTPAPALALHALAAPSHFSAVDTEECLANEPWGCDMYQVTATNTGSEPASGPITLTDALPAGLNVVHVGLFLARNEQTGYEHEAPEGEALEESLCKPEAVPVSCEFAGTLEPDQRLQMQVFVTVEPGATSAPGTASVLETGNPVASTSANDVVSGIPPAFGPSALLAGIDGPDGALDTQAGAHPFEFVTRIDFNTEMGHTTANQTRPGPGQGGVRDVVVDLPVGFLGSATSTPTCTFSQLQAFPNSCPRDTIVGHIATESEFEIEANGPIYNMAPRHGVAAEFGFIDFLSTTHVIDANVVPTADGYVLRAIAREAPKASWMDVTTTFYGDPAAKNGGGATPVAQFTNSADCSGRPLASTVFLDSWEHPATLNADGTPNVEGAGSAGWASASSESPPVTGCNQLRFAPSGFSFQPETTTANKPTGVTFDLKIPQTETPETLATPPLRDATVALPEGLTVDPSAASGLQACSEAEIGWRGPVPAEGGRPANPGYSNFTEAAPSCPEASRVGSVELTSPLVEGTLQGSVYLATQYANPYGSLLAGYIVIDDPTTGTIVKVPGELRTDPVTGQITGIFDDNPQIPFSDLKIHFFGGSSRGDLATPEACGTYTTTADLEPWSAPESGPDATPSDSFPINTGCVAGFTPAFSAGTINNQAGAFSTFTLSFSRQDSEEGPAGLTVSLPRGLLGKIAGVAECPDAQIALAAANSGAAEQGSPSCPSASQLGTVSSASGPGPNPFVSGGKAYLTGPYKGAPYGIAVIVPAVAGPFDLGTVVIRQALFIDPNDAHVTDVSDPLPRILKGIPLRIKRVSVTLDRPEFTFNPTSCEVKTIAATVTSIGGAHAPVSSRFQAAGCAGLPFKPHFSASTLARTSKANGASLRVKIASAGVGQAGIAKVDLTIPAILPSRLTTLQKACSEAQFNANPAGCPAASDIATAVVHTPLLPDPLSGPVYFVSHGAAAFPDTEIILQGDGVTLILDGHTQIKNGVTYSRFETVPDAPFTSFEFDAPEGRYSIFSANGNLCHTEVRMPTSITAQNGAVLNQNTLVEPEGCPDALTIISHRVKGRTVTLKVAVPGAGKLTAVGRHLTKVTKTARGRSTVTLSLKANRRGKLASKVRLTFTPSKGRKLRAAVTARFTR
jgi:hypothetical protein